MARKGSKYRKKTPKSNIYRIILTNNGNKIKVLALAKTEAKIREKFDKMLKENKRDVLFPKKYIVQEHSMFPSDYELVVLKVRDEYEDAVTKIKDSDGKYVNYSTTDSRWVVIDRAQYEIEESFWVYGYHPRFERKDYKWIMDNLIEKGSKDKSSFKSIQVYLNKVIIEIDGKIEMVICKNKSDSHRLYNQIQEDCIEKKLKRIAFMGALDKSKYKHEWIQRLMKLTNWSWTKVTRISTRE
jgi:hypothetical protein